MQYREIGSSGIFASAIAFGAWAIGGGPWWGERDDAESIRTIHAALDAGITLLDTAPLYGNGRSEKIIGEAILGRRDKVVVATKCGLWTKDERGSFFFEQNGKNVMRSLRPDTIREEIEVSLRLLQTDYIDLYQTHWQAIEPECTPIADTMATLLQLRDEGKIRAIGVSNATPPQMDEYLQCGRIESNQPRYSMLDRTIEDELLPYCREKKISILAYSPLEQGLLTGRMTMETEIPAGHYRNNLPWFKPENRRRVIAMLDSWQELTKKYSCTTAQLVIAWTIQQPGVTFALCGASKPRQAEENAAAGNIIISEIDLQDMRRAIEALGSPQ